MWIKANHEKIRYTGRIDWSRPEEPLWVYPCTSAEFRFTGSVLKIYVQNYHYTGKIISAALLTMYRPVIISIIMVDWL